MSNGKAAADAAGRQCCDHLLGLCERNDLGGNNPLNIPAALQELDGIPVDVAKLLEARHYSKECTNVRVRDRGCAIRTDANTKNI